ncbi:ribonuclease H-like domain-containing protein [Thermosulfuriphilus sp.]
MLFRTFVHLPGIGEAREKAIWAQGVQSWADFLAEGKLVGFSRAEMALYRAFIYRSLDRARDPVFWAQSLPRPHLWRLIPHFGTSTVYLDIETTGLSPHRNIITVIGLYDGRSYRALIQGQDLEEILDILPSYAQVVTFGGSRFDLPFLKAHFPSLCLPPLHHDLSFLFRRLGLKGGLKRIERELGICRPADISDLSGLEAIRLWYQAQRGKEGALETLIEYNRADVVNLAYLTHLAWEGLCQKLDTLGGQP